ncbi:MAG: hypothetical protein IT210_20495 [Armatimonadetes bacterium]|nr:hypothetical protein [Armatimonadota bacterium]
MPTVYVCLWFDTEDFIAPIADDAARDVAQVMTGEGVPGTFKLVGEKARSLERRDRWDAISALGRHDIGYHTNYHSIHPTITEYVRGLGWDEGASEFERREESGLRDLERIFCTEISCYGQPGGAWAPQAFPALKKWGLIYVDEGDNIGFREEPFWYCNTLTVFRLHWNCHRADLWGSDAEYGSSLERFDEIYNRLSRTGGLISIFYHPTEFVHAEFWDCVNYRHGINIDPKDWKMPRQRSEDEARTGYERFRHYLRHILSKPEAQVVTAAELPDLYPDLAAGHLFTAADIAAISRQCPSGIRELEAGPGFLSPAEQFALLSGFLRQRGVGSVSLRQPLGPKERILTTRLPLEVSIEAFMDAAGRAEQCLELAGHLPDQVAMAGTSVAPAEMMLGMAQVCEALIHTGQLPGEITLRPADFQMESYAEDSDHLWDWMIFAEDFTAPRVVELTRLQTWTLKPARLAL